MSMTIREACAITDQVCKLNAYDNETKTRWLSELDGQIQSELYHWSPSDIIHYDWDSCAEHQLLADPPYDAMYPRWLVAQIDLANGEYEKYHNDREVFNQIYQEYARWLVREKGGVIA
mgnify:FL=1